MPVRFRQSILAALLFAVLLQRDPDGRVNDWKPAVRCA
jgi:hypothetical protein